MLATLLWIVIVLMVLGVLVYLAETYLPMPRPFRIVIRLVVVVGIVIWLAYVLDLVRLR